MFFPDIVEIAIKKLPSSLVVLTDPSKGGAKDVYQLLHSLELEKKYGLDPLNIAKKFIKIENTK